MKKLLLSMAAVAMAATASAQLADGEYCIKNAENDGWLNSGHSWGTGAVTINQLRVFEVTNNTDGTCKVKSSLGWWKGGDETFIDGGENEAASFEFVRSGDKYQIKHGGKYFTLNEVINCADPDNWWTGRTCHGAVMTTLGRTDNAADATLWEIFSIADMKKAMENASEENPVEATFFLKNGMILKNDGTNISAWNVTKNGIKEDLVVPAAGWIHGSDEWHNQDLYGWFINDKTEDGNTMEDSEDTIEQVAEGLPAGKYSVAYKVVNQSNTPASLDINGSLLPVADFNDSDLWYNTAFFALQASEKTGNFTVGEDGKLSLKMVKQSKAGQQNRLAFKSFRLSYYGNGDAGVTGVEVDENAPVEYYNLQGVRVANPLSGLYIQKKGNKAAKVMF